MELTHAQVNVFCELLQMFCLSANGIDGLTIAFEREGANACAETKNNVQHQLNVFDMYQYQLCPQSLLETYSDDYQLLARDHLLYPIESSLLRLC